VSLPIIVRGACPHDCPDTCAIETTVVEGRATAVRGAKEHPITRGFLCAKVNRYLERVHHPERLTVPLRRSGAKGPGRGEWVAASWDEAIDAIGGRLQSIIADHGPESILPYSYSGTLGLIQGGGMSDRFFHRIGAANLERTICSAAGKAGWQSVYGPRLAPALEDVVHARLILLWGTNTLTSNPHLWPFIVEARAKGARLITIDPIRTRTARASDEHLPIFPGSDAALALSMMHVLFRDGLVDEEFLADRTVGAEDLRRRVLTEWDPQRAAAITGVPASRIEALAHEYAQTSPTFIRLNFGLQRHAGGASAVRAIGILPSLTGAWRHRGGGAMLATSGHFGLDTATLDGGKWFDAARRTVSMIQIGRALTEADDPLRALVVYNANPAAVAPDLGAVRSGLAREDLFTVVIEHFETDTADYADWLLPATMQLEHWDLHTAYGHSFLTLNKPAVPAQGECLPNSEIFRRLAVRLGLTEVEFTESDEAMIRSVLTDQQWADLDRVGWIRMSTPTPYVTGPLQTPSGRIQLVAPELAGSGVDPVPDYVPPAERPTASSRYRLMLLSPPEHGFMNSTFANIPALARKAGPTRVYMHPDDARTRQLTDGQPVTVYNDRGRFDASLVESTDVLPGVAVSYGVRWARTATDGRTVNDTTGQTLTDLGRGATFYDNAVEIAAR
jgi:anaerobic selenocysteine-containing dehydrogenase